MQLTLTLPDELVAHFPNEEALCRTVYEDFIIEQRQSGRISLSRAAELLGISYEAFFFLLGEKGISFTNASTEELTESYSHFEALMKRE